MLLEKHSPSRATPNLLWVWTLRRRGRKEADFDRVYEHSQARCAMRQVFGTSFHALQAMVMLRRAPLLAS
jgi:hypothetical protein